MNELKKLTLKQFNIIIDVYTFEIAFEAKTFFKNVLIFYLSMIRFSFYLIRFYEVLIFALLKQYF